MRTTAFSTLLWIAIANSHAFAQSAGNGGSPTDYRPTMTFDVASIRETKVGNEITVSGMFPLHESTLRVQNFDISNLVTMAYGLNHYQLLGIPSWAFETVYTIQARSDDATDTKLAHLSDHDARLERQHMMQVLLADRFHLQTHWEIRQGPTYELVVSKPGLLKETSPSDAEQDKTTKHPPLYQQGGSNTGFKFIAHGASIEMIRNMLEGQFGRPVVDKTGLSGKYDFVLPYKGRFDSDRNPDDTDAIPTLDRSLQDTLGLKVKPSRGDISVIVIDHVDEHPSEN